MLLLLDSISINRMLQDCLCFILHLSDLVTFVITCKTKASTITFFLFFLDFRYFTVGIRICENEWNDNFIVSIRNTNIHNSSDLYLFSAPSHPTYHYHARSFARLAPRQSNKRHISSTPHPTDYSVLNITKKRIVISYCIMPIFRKTQKKLLLVNKFDFRWETWVYLVNKLAIRSMQKFTLEWY